MNENIKSRQSETIASSTSTSLRAACPALHEPRGLCVLQSTRALGSGRAYRRCVARPTLGSFMAVGRWPLRPIIVPTCYGPLVITLPRENLPATCMEPRVPFHRASGSRLVMILEETEVFVWSPSSAN